MIRRPQIGFLVDGRLHLLDGPIDLIVEARGADRQVRLAYEAAIRRFSGLLDALCGELQELRRAAQPGATALQGAVARSMHAAVAPCAADHFITPMAAVAGAVAEEVLGAMTEVSDLERAYVNNGGDIALHLSDGQYFTVGLIDLPDPPSLIGKTWITSRDPSRGVATSGRHGRSFSLGIADAVTVLAATGAAADAAATVIANAVDIPGHPKIVRVPANELQPDSDLGDRHVTRDVGQLSSDEIQVALAAGVFRARELMVGGLIDGAAFHLKGETRIVALNIIHQLPTQLLSRAEARAVKERFIHA